MNYPATLLLTAALIASSVSGACISSGNETAINSLFQSGGAGKIVQICPSTTITIFNTITFTADNQELSTSGYPTGSTRAVIQIAGSGAGSLSTLVNGQGRNFVKLKNIVIDGNRGAAGYQNGGGANIEFGQGSNGAIVSYVGSKNCRAWSCMHIMESGDSNNACRNSTITNNDIGPCGVDANGQWSDGISFACTNSVVANNTITGSTDGGIVLFGAPNTSVTGNTIKSSATYVGFGAINLVDYLYGGSYSGVKVMNNIIQGARLFKVGIAVGSNVWGGDSNGNFLSGPTTIANNVFSGNVTFPIALNGWKNGINITGNTVSAVTKPNSAFAEPTGCSAGTQYVFNNNLQQSYWSPGVQGTTNIPGFVNASGGEPTYFLCVTTPLPTSISYATGGYGWQGSGGAPLAELHNGIRMQFQGSSDANLVILNTTNNNQVLWASGHTASCGTGSSSCDLSWQADGNLVSYSNQYSNVLWASGTNPNGTTLVCKNTAPVCLPKRKLRGPRPELTRYSSGSKFWTASKMSSGTRQSSNRTKLE